MSKVIGHIPISNENSNLYKEVMEPISIRYAESVELEVTTDDEAAVSATFFVGKPGELPKITIPATFVDGVAVFVLEETDTSIPLGEYRYQYTVTHADGKVEKYPSPEDCDCDDFEDSLPVFKVYEALDSTEIS